MTTQKTYTNKSNAARAAKGANGGTLNGLVLLGSEGAWYYGTPADAPAAAVEAATALHEAAAATEHAAVALEQSAAPAAAPRKPKAAVKKPVAKAAPKKEPAKKTAAKAAPKAAPPGKEIAGAYPGGVKTIPANAKKGTRTVTGYKLEQDRAEAHGVQRKSKGTVGDQLWALFDKALEGMRKKDKSVGAKDLALGAVRKVGVDAGFNNTTVALAFYQWRRFHGVRGRGKKQKVD